MIVDMKFTRLGVGRYVTDDCDMNFTRSGVWEGVCFVVFFGN